MANRQSELEFQSWMPTKRFAAQVRKLCNETDLAELFRRKYKFALESYIAASAAEQLQAQQIRHVPQRRHGPDFELILRDGRKQSFQLVELQRQGRRRGDEYAAWKLENYAPKMGAWTTTNSDAALSQLRTLAIKKAEIPYVNMALIVYVNLDIDDLSTFERNMASAVEAAHGKFLTVWVFWNKRLWRCWPQPYVGSDAHFRPDSRTTGTALRRYQQQQMFNTLFKR